MKYFFHTKKELTNDIIRKISPFKSGTGELVSVLCYDEKNQAEQFKRLYDAADIIADKRYETNDDELDNFFDDKSRKEGIPIPRLLSMVLEKTKSLKQEDRNKLHILECMYEVSKSILENETDPDSELQIFSLLTQGNICIRISRAYYQVSDFENSNKFGDLAGEYLWRGKNLVEQESEKSEFPMKKVRLTLLNFALRINHARYFLDYARKNRRSNYSSANDELDSLIHDIELFSKEQNGKEKSDSDVSVHRGLALIYINAKLTKIAILRRKYEQDSAKKEIDSLKQIIHESESSPQTDESTMDIVNMLKGLERYDSDRSILLTLLNQARILRDKHDKDEYIEAIKIALRANEYSKKMDSSDKNNIDALIILSSILRKLVRYYHLNIKETPEKNILIFWNESEQDENNNTIDSRIPNIFKELKQIAKSEYFDAKSERIKWYYLNLNLKADNEQEIRELSDYPCKEEIKKYFSGQENDLRLRFLKAVFYFKEGDHTTAKETFEDLLRGENYRDLTKYIRPNTIGLKSRYLLARIYLSEGNCEKAKQYLEEVKNTIDQLRSSDSSYKDYQDDRTMIDLAYCYIRQGNYEGAYDLYKKYYQVEKQDIFGEEGQNEQGIQGKVGKRDELLSQLPQQSRIAALNNLIRCCLFSIKTPENDSKTIASQAVDYLSKYYPQCFASNLNEGQLAEAIEPFLQNQSANRSHTNINAGERVKIADRVIRYLDSKYGEQIRADTETALLRGYLCLMNEPNSVSVEASAFEKALTNFEAACGYKEGFKTIHVDRLDDKSQKRHNVEKISAYLITVIRLWKLNAEKGDEYAKKSAEYENRIKRFLRGVTRRVTLSLKATISLAEWLLDYVDLKQKENKYLADSDPQKKAWNTERETLLRSFCYVSIYSERGAEVFNQLKNHPDFRLLKTHHRGEILALLLAMYKPIKALKEECSFTLDDLKLLDDLNQMNSNNDSNSPWELVHYTSMNTLKILMKEDVDRTTSKSEPRFRINNCGYMNDVFEGSVFLRCLRQIARCVEEREQNKPSSADGQFSQMLNKYFPYLEMSATDRKPVASNVYIGSLSVKADSFPIWDSYADKEQGCNIHFDAGYFDINGPSYYPSQLREYLISNKTDDSYPLYIVQYIETGKNFETQIKKYLENGDCKTEAEPLTKLDIHLCRTRRQHCGTEVIEYTDLCHLLHYIYLRWKKLSNRLNDIEKENSFNDDIDKETNLFQKRIELARQFAADRINEIRFLFKDADYEFEAEVRIVHTETKDQRKNSGIDYNQNVPRPYTNIDRDLKGLTIRLGSKISDSDVDKVVTWLKHTGRVNTVKLSTRNRYISRTTQSTIQDTEQITFSHSPQSRDN